MSDVAALFWDVGGVLLSNGWDHSARSEAARRFGLDAADFEQRHRGAEDDLETGRLTLHTYLDRTVFFLTRPFTRDAVKSFIFAHSTDTKQPLLLLAYLTPTPRLFRP